MYLVIEPVIAVVEPVEVTFERVMMGFCFMVVSTSVVVTLVSMDVVVKVASTGSATVCRYFAVPGH